MSRFDDLRASAAFAKLSPITPAQAANIRRNTAGVPTDYVEFLSEIGAGEIGKAEFMLYPGLVPASDVFGPKAAEKLKHVRLFGDDFQGYSSGFDTSCGWSVVDVDPISHAVDEVAATFESFIREWSDGTATPEQITGL